MADLGCGTGYGSAFLAGKGDVVAVDVSASATRYARIAHEGPEYVTGTCESIPLRDGCVDMVVAFEVIEHLAYPRRFLSECRRITKMGGMVFISTPNPAHLVNRVRNKVFGVPIPQKTWSGNAYHRREFTHNEMLELLAQEDFNLQEAIGQTLSIPFVKGWFHLIGLGGFGDWLSSRAGFRFPKISDTVLYVAVRE